MGAQGFQGLLDGVSRETLQEDGVFFRLAAGNGSLQMGV
jgi:hypothetical protein